MHAGSLYWLHVAGIIDAQIMNGWNMVYTAICLKSKRVEVIALLQATYSTHIPPTPVCVTV